MGFLAVILGFLPGFAWLYFYMQEDPHPEPKGQIFKTFCFGMVGAVFALLAEKLFNQYVPANHASALVGIISLLGISLIEEIAKFFSAWTAVRKNPAFSEPVDAMIYSLVAALGFATLENIGAITGPFVSPTGVATISTIFEMISFRFVGATLLHALTGAIIGYHWAWAIRKFGRWRILVSGIAIATLLHAFFNYLILNFESYVQPIAFLMIVGFFVLSDFEKLRNKKI
ncbi:MAG: PrsW family glutamic-type intramembrane protease [Candidatus Liptonbacteria bacterium]|nr:PrsW family glutamic-type intramembrane protease [Candidatus Liptonbacteria bacterium]